MAPHRRGAAFGAILAAFDTGIGTGSTMMGWIIQHAGFQAAFGTAAATLGARAALLHRHRPRRVGSTSGSRGSSAASG